MYVTLDEAKKQCVVDFADDDQYITDLIPVAEVVIENAINNKLINLEDESHNIPGPLKWAILLMIAHLYSNREPVSFSAPSKVPYTVEDLVKPYINYAS